MKDTTVDMVMKEEQFLFQWFLEVMSAQPLMIEAERL